MRSLLKTPELNRTVPKLASRYVKLAAFEDSEDRVVAAAIVYCRQSRRRLPSLGETNDDDEEDEDNDCCAFVPFDFDFDLP